MDPNIVQEDLKIMQWRICQASKWGGSDTLVVIAGADKVHELLISVFPIQKASLLESEKLNPPVHEGGH